MCTRCNFIWQILSVTCCRSANFSGNSGFLHQYNWQSLYKFEILLTFSEVLGHIWSRIWPVCGSNLQSLSFSLTYQYLSYKVTSSTHFHGRNSNLQLIVTDCVWVRCEPVYTVTSDYLFFFPSLFIFIFGGEWGRGIVLCLSFLRKTTSDYHFWYPQACLVPLK
jgi:hypothetical protein